MVSMLGIILGLIVAITLGVIIPLRVISILEKRKSKSTKVNSAERQTEGLSNRKETEIGTLIDSANEMTTTFREIITKMRETSEKISSFAQTMNESSKAIHASRQKLQASVKNPRQADQLRRVNRLMTQLADPQADKPSEKRTVDLQLYV